MLVWSECDSGRLPPPWTEYLRLTMEGGSLFALLHQTSYYLRFSHNTVSYWALLPKRKKGFRENKSYSNLIICTSFSSNYNNYFFLAKTFKVPVTASFLFRKTKILSLNFFHLLHLQREILFLIFHLLISERDIAPPIHAPTGWHLCVPRPGIEPTTRAHQDDTPADRATCPGPDVFNPNSYTFLLNPKISLLKIRLTKLIGLWTETFISKK